MKKFVSLTTTVTLTLFFYGFPYARHGSVSFTRKSPFQSHNHSIGEVLLSSFSEKETEAQTGGIISHRHTARDGECGALCRSPLPPDHALHIMSFAGAACPGRGFLLLRLLLFSEGFWVHVHSKKGTPRERQ